MKLKFWVLNTVSDLVLSSSKISFKLRYFKIAKNKLFLEKLSSFIKVQDK